MPEYTEAESAEKRKSGRLVAWRNCGCDNLTQRPPPGQQNQSTLSTNRPNAAIILHAPQSALR